MKIVTWNVNGIRSVVRKGFFNWIAKESPDVVCLQEIKISEEDLTFDLRYPTNYYSYFNCALKKGYAGTAVYVKRNAISVVNKMQIKNKTVRQFNNEGRFQELDFNDFKLINVYMPHGARDKSKLSYKLDVYKCFIQYLSTLLSERVVVCGDFNIAHTQLDLARPKENINNIMFTIPERIQIEKILENNFSDAFRLFIKGGGYYTWWPYRKVVFDKNIGWRIDYIFLSKSLIKCAKNVSIKSDFRVSDHAPVFLELSV